MEKNTTLDGQGIGLKILDNKYRPPLKKNSKSLLNLTKLRRDNTFKNRWNILWTWRGLENIERVIFFRIQSLIRNSVFQKKRVSFEKKKDLTGFLNYAEKKWFISPALLIRYGDISSISPLHSQSSGTLIQDDVTTGIGDILTSLSDVQRKALSFEMQQLSPWIVQAHGADPEKAFNECFKESDFLGSYLDETFLDKTQVFNYSEWTNDTARLAEDRFYKEPVIYLRIPTQYYDSAVWYAIDQHIKKRIEELNYRSMDINKYQSAELALMVFDLFQAGLTIPGIGHIILDLAEHHIDVREKKRQAERYIKNSLQ